MATLALIIVAIVIIFALFGAWCCFKVGAKADQAPLEPKESKFLTVTCSECEKIFVINEDEALVKMQYGTEYLVCCPLCNKLTKAYINK